MKELGGDIVCGFKTKEPLLLEWFFSAGGDDRIRTGDLGLDRAAC